MKLIQNTETNLVFTKTQKKNFGKTVLSKNEIYLNQILKICKDKNVELSFLYIPAKEYFAQGGITGTIKEHTSEAHKQENPHFLQIEKICKDNALKCYYANEYFI
jgi:hypothetical protein